MLWLTDRERATLLALGVAALLGLAVQIYRAAHERVVITVTHAAAPDPSADDQRR